MRNPIENLGDYNKVREDLQATGGDLKALYKSVGDTAVAKIAPKLLLGGILIGGGLLFVGQKGICYMKDRKQKINNEPVLKKNFFETLEVVSVKVDDEEHIDSDASK